MNRKFVHFSLIIFLVLSTGTTSAKTWYVDDDDRPGIDFIKIQDAIDSSSAFDTIFVYNGTYYENIILKEDVNVQGEGAPITTIDGQKYGPVVYGAEGATIAGFTIVNSSNTGIMCYHSSPLIEFNIISGHNVGILNYQSSAKIIGNEFRNNNNGIYIHYSSPWIESNRITDDSYGIVSRYSSSPTIVGNELLHTHIDFGYASNGTVINNLIIGGSSGIRVFSSSSPTIINNVITDATSEAGIVVMESSPLIANNIIVNNNLGIDCQYGSGTPQLSHNNIWGNIRGNYVAGCAPGQGDISTDPMFVDAISNNYRLQSVSPCIDSGINTGAPNIDFDGNLRPIDGDGDGNAIVDIGAFEYKPVFIQAKIDVTPNTLNLKSKGKWITVYIELPQGYDVNNIDVNTIMLNNQVHAEEGAKEIGDHDDNGINDLMQKFNRSAVQEILIVGDEVQIIISGELIGGASFKGTDIIKVKKGETNMLD